jgi:hypothetical protein
MSRAQGATGLPHGAQQEADAQQQRGTPSRMIYIYSQQLAGVASLIF